jgi:hypothetical protein
MMISDLILYMEYAAKLTSLKKLLFNYLEIHTTTGKLYWL